MAKLLADPFVEIVSKASSIEDKLQVFRIQVQVILDDTPLFWFHTIYFTGLKGSSSEDYDKKAKKNSQH